MGTYPRFEFVRGKVPGARKTLSPRRAGKCRTDRTYRSGRKRCRNQPVLHAWHDSVLVSLWYRILLYRRELAIITDTRDQHRGRGADIPEPTRNLSHLMRRAYYNYHTVMCALVAHIPVTVAAVDTRGSAFFLRRIIVHSPQPGCAGIKAGTSTH